MKVNRKCGMQAVWKSLFKEVKYICGQDLDFANVDKRLFDLCDIYVQLY